MSRRPATKSSSKIVTPNLPQHNLPEPFASLQTAGYEEQIELYQEICCIDDPEEISSRIDQLTNMALDESYYSYSSEDLEEEADPRCFAPLQAVRALCYFADDVVRVVPRLIPLFETDDSALREELPLLFSCIGPEAADTLISITLDTEADIYLRDGAAESLVEMTNVVPEMCTVVQATLEVALVGCNDVELGGYLVLDLLDLGAIESLPIIELAFKESRVDTDIVTLAEVHEHFDSISDEAKVYQKKLKLIHIIDGEVEDEYQEPYIAPEKVGRNDPCPCGSGKKYKKCCGDNKS